VSTAAPASATSLSGHDIAGEPSDEPPADAVVADGSSTVDASPAANPASEASEALDPEQQTAVSAHAEAESTTDENLTQQVPSANSASAKDGAEGEEPAGSAAKQQGPAPGTLEQHLEMLQQHEHSVLVDSFWADAEEVSKAAEPDDGDQGLSTLDHELSSSVNDQYAQLGITVDDLRTYLDVAVDIEDAISVGRKPKLNEERYKVYKRVDKLIKFGPDKSPEELERLHVMAEKEMLSLPWPTTMVRKYLKEKGGLPLKPMRKLQLTTYDQVHALNALTAVRLPSRSLARGSTVLSAVCDCSNVAACACVVALVNRSKADVCRAG
jgi:hypothetical protein